MLSEEKQRILILERVIHFHIYTSIFLIILLTKSLHFLFVIAFQLFVIVFQTLHMKEEENKRLNQRLVIYMFINLYVNMRVVTVLALIVHQNVLIV